MTARAPDLRDLWGASRARLGAPRGVQERVLGTDSGVRVALDLGGVYGGDLDGGENLGVLKPNGLRTIEVTSGTIQTMNKRRKPKGSADKAIALVRASTSDQRLSPKAQRSAIEAWASRQGVSVIAYHVEEGVSGATPLDQRSGLLAAIEDVERHGAGHLVVARRDRLARDVVVAGMIERLVERGGARVSAADGTGDGDGPESILLRSITDVFAMYERLVIGFRTRAALQAKKARGQRVGTVPFGWTLDGDGKTLIPNYDEMRVMETIRRLRSRGLSLRKVVSECERRGIVSRSGKPLGLAQVERIIRRADESRAA